MLFSTDERTTIDGPACEECGYSLEGLIVRPETWCPECGVTMLDGLWTPQPWPSRRWVLVLVCGPLAATLAVLLVAHSVPVVRNWFVWPLGLLWVAAIVSFGVFAPIGMAKSLVAAREPKIRRRAVMWRITVTAIAFNAALAAGAGLVFFAML